VIKQDTLGFLADRMQGCEFFGHFHPALQGCIASMGAVSNGPGYPVTTMEGKN